MSDDDSETQPQGKAMTTRQRYLRHVRSDLGLTPLQKLVLKAFDDGSGHDRVTIASYLDGQCQQITSSKSLMAVADDVLRQLNDIGLTRQDEMGWHWKAST